MLLFTPLARSNAPAYPVIFVHGLNESGADFKAMRHYLDSTAEFTGQRMIAWKIASGLLSCSGTNDWDLTLPTYKPIAPEKVAGRYFAIDFSSPNNLTLSTQGSELKQVIDCVKSITAQQKVILVAHSMGGLAARAYLQNGAGSAPYLPGGANSKAYEKDVAKLITFGTPHQGSPWPSICQASELATIFLPPLAPTEATTGICFLAVKSPFSNGVNSLKQPWENSDSEMRRLDNSYISELPTTDISYSSIIVVGAYVYPSLDDGDGVVTQKSQDLGQLSSTITHKKIVTHIVPTGCQTSFGLELHTCELGNKTIHELVFLEVFRTSAGTTIQPPALSPAVSTLPPSAASLNSSNATLAGRIDPVGKPFSAWFEWGPTAALGRFTAAQSFSAGTSSIVVNQTIFGLISGTPYQYRVVAQNDAGPTPGEIVPFTTPPASVASLPAPHLFTPTPFAWYQSTTPTFTWSSVTNAASYRLMVAPNLNALPTDKASKTCSSCAINVTPSTTAYVASAGALQPGTLYWWQVKARGATEYGDWSAPQALATAVAPTTPLPAPTLSIPVNGATTASVTPLMAWSQVSNADNYWIMIADSPTNLPSDSRSLTCPLCAINDISYANTYQVSSGQLIAGRTYYWQVNARNSTTSGTWSSPIGSFVAGGVPAANNATCGTSAGGTFTSAPTANFCSVGTPSAVTGNGPWFWGCTANGYTQNCAANIQAFTISTSTSGSGTIAPTSATVDLGKTVSFTIAPKIGFRASVSGCGIYQSWVASPSIFTTAAVTGTCTVTVTFTSNPTTKYSKVCNSGQDAGQGSCPAAPLLASGSTDWGCTRDNTNGLLWEVKVVDGGMRDKSGTYTWYDQNTLINGGNPGVINGGVCVGSRCDTAGFADAVTATALCGANNWRVPTHEELLTLIDASNANNGLPAVDANYFPNTQEAPYWSGTTYLGNSTSAWEMNFYHEYADGSYGKGFQNRVRLVSGGSPAGPFTLTVTLTGSGSVTSSPTGISCGNTCSLSLDGGTSLTLSAAPEASATFVGWGGACSGTSATCTVTMAQYREVTAQFTSLVVNGTCGSANGSSYPMIPPAADLCTTGSVGPVSGVGPWTWPCGGIHQGSTASCSAAMLASSATLTNLSISGPASLTQGSSASYGLIATYSDGSSHPITLGPAAGTIVPVAGHGKLVDYVNANGLALAANGDLFFSDPHTVRILSAAGSLSTIAGNGTSGFSGDGGPATAAQFRTPNGIALSPTGDLYVADTANQRIRKISSSSTITTVAGTGTTGYSGDNGPATSAQLWYPVGVALDGSGNLYISEFGRIRRVAVNGTISTFAGNGSQGYSGDNGPATSAQLSASGLAIDGSGNLLFADDSNRIRRVSAADGIISTIAGTGTCGHVGDNGLATLAQVCRPNSIFIDPNNNIYVADNTTIRRISATGIIKAIAGGGQPQDNIGDYGPATSAEISPNAVVVDTRSNVYIADGNGQSIREVLAAGGGSLSLSTTSIASLSGGTVQAGAVTANQTITINAGYVENGITKTATLPVSVSVSAPTPAVAQIVLTVPNPFSAQIGTTSAPQNITVTNTGNATLNISNIASSGDFAQSGCSATLSPGASCNVSVAFTPTAIGPRNGNLMITSDAAGSPRVVSLIGTGTAAAVADVLLSSTALNFAAQAVGTASTGQSVTLTNIGNAPLNVSSVVTSGDFTGVGYCGTSTTGTVLAVGQACSISVVFAPTAMGTRAGTISITSNAASGPINISLSGVGALDTQTITFGVAPAIVIGGTGTVVATGGPSGNPVVFSGTTPGICTVSGGVVIGVNAGNCVIAVNQAGNANYSAALQATQIITVPAATQTLNFTAGWNLVGNGYNVSLDVASTFGDPTKVLSVWKWIRDTVTPTNDSKWAFYATNNGTTITDNGAAYAAGKGYLPLATIQAGEGYWINATAPFAVSVPTGRAVIASDLRSLPTGWNLISTGNQSTPSRFNIDLSNVPPSPGVVPNNVISLWVWDGISSKWYFYSSALESQGGTSLFDYTVGKGYLDFLTAGKTLGPGVGFWLNVPQ